ncbi:MULTISPECIES: hypothetical protein [Nocardia]|uniref:Uncharacterized protein n=1 Tax=Nocardia nova TaxID=37330 RepID=A0A2T2ZE14_9NOCA|nr:MULTISPECIES: hypothetical protein [Nocardia]PSR66018.1 hypothetical protein C8259_01265 [Nocardia nova]
MTQRRNKLREWTDRDDQMMRFLAQQWCADLTAVRLALGIGRARAYELLIEWRDDFQMINCENIRPGGQPGESYTVMWLRPSKVERFLGRKPHRPWTATRSNIAHKVQVARTRAALCGLDAENWVPERQLWRGAWQTAGMSIGGAGLRTGRVALRTDGAHLPASAHSRGGRSLPHVHDGRYRQGDRWWSVEVELTLKKNSARLASTVLAAVRALPAGDSLLYLYANDRVGNALDRTITHLIETGQVMPRRTPIRTLDLDTVISNRNIDLPGLAS